MVEEGVVGDLDGLSLTAIRDTAYLLREVSIATQAARYLLAAGSHNRTLLRDVA